MRITTQSAMNRARARVRFCYLCGGQLCAPDSKRHQSKLQIEHVLPKSLYPAGSPENSARWPVTLYVHPACDQRDKGRGDDVLRLLHRFATSHMTGDRLSAGAFRRLDMRPAQIRTPRGLVCGLDGIDRLCEFAWQWVRGLHAALYGECLPHVVKHEVFPPAPIAVAKDMSLDGKLSPAVWAKVARAESADTWDGIECWGGAVRYHCLWFQPPLAHTGDPAGWICAWTLVYPYALDWSATMMLPGREFGWHGCYVLSALPAGAAVVSDDRNTASGQSFDSTNLGAQPNPPDTASQD